MITKIAVLPFDKFNNLRKIKSVHCPVLIVHGTADSVINVSHGKQLFAAANQPKQAVWVEGANHNNVDFVSGAAYFNELKDFEGLIRQNQKKEQTNGTP